MLQWRHSISHDTDGTEHVRFLFCHIFASPVGWLLRLQCARPKRTEYRLYTSTCCCSQKSWLWFDLTLIVAQDGARRSRATAACLIQQLLTCTTDASLHAMGHGACDAIRPLSYPLALAASVGADDLTEGREGISFRDDELAVLMGDVPLDVALIDQVGKHTLDLIRVHQHT